MLWVMWNSLAPGESVIIAPGTAATIACEGRTAMAWKPSRQRRAPRRLDEEIFRHQGGLKFATFCQAKFAAEVGVTFAHSSEYPREAYRMSPSQASARKR